MGDDDGGPAFPRAGFFNEDGPPECDGVSYTGMSLRDWFAGQALSGFCASEGLIGLEGLAEDAYGVADQMLEKREKSDD